MIRPIAIGKKNIPAILAGMLFFGPLVSLGSEALVLSLFGEGDWGGCHREFRRLVLGGDTPSLVARFADAVSLARGGRDQQAALAALTPLSIQTEDLEIASMAAYERGRMLWEADRIDEAFASCRQAFLTTRDRDLFLHAACTIFFMMKEAPRLRDDNMALDCQIQSTRDLWSGPLISDCRRVPRGQPHHKAKPAQWLVRFYRSQISPAIGARCVLEPSCSEYFLQASRKHGILGWSMLADRLCREPTVSQAKEDPVIVNGQVRYRDSVETHDFWNQP